MIPFPPSTLIDQEVSVSHIIGTQGSGEVDALVINEGAGQQVFTLKGADHSYRLLVEEMNEGAVVMTSDGVIMYTNRRFAEMIRVPMENVIGSEIARWIAPDSRNRFQSLLESNSEKERVKEITLIASNGTLVSVHLSAIRHSTTDMPDYVCLVATDLSEINQRKRMEELAISISEYTRSLIEASPDALMAISTEYKITDVNNATVSVTGIERAKLIGSDFARYCIDPEAARAMLRLVFLQGFVVDYPLSVKHLSGSVASMLYSANLFHDHHGNVLGALASAHDVTKCKQIEAQLALEQLNRDKDLFLANMSHELRTPLTAILQFAALAKRRLMEGEHAGAMVMLDGLLAGKRRLLRFVTNLEHLARIHVGQWTFQFMTGDLMPLVQEVVRAKQQRFAEKHLQWRVLAPQTVSTRFDAPSVSIILNELLDNAGLFSPPEGVVDLKVTKSGGQVQITILDSGPGIPVGEEESIFSPFVESSRTRSNAGGTGLGLSIARGLARQHKGRILIVNRQDGQGAEVTLLLPGGGHDER
ncbi:MAG: PAS domain-containing sensor histidine kinase [Magnetococcus sp. YQC-5]